jgi:hypothetical protein
VVRLLLPLKMRKTIDDQIYGENTSSSTSPQRESNERYITQRESLSSGLKNEQEGGVATARVRQLDRLIADIESELGAANH